MADAADTVEQVIGLNAVKAISVVTATAGASVLSVPEAPDSPMLNRVVGLGAGRPATEADIDEALAAFDPGTSFYVSLAPGARPAALPDWLRARGLQPGWGWMRFRRGIEDPAPGRTSLRVVEAERPAETQAFARVVRESYGLAEAVEPRLARAPEAGWQCWVAFEGAEPAAAAGLYADGDVAYLGFAGTLAEHRGKGAQSALLTRRIQRARELGCRRLVTETGERDAGRPSNSYRNILRAGFTEVSVTANWLGRA